MSCIIVQLVGSREGAQETQTQCQQREVMQEAAEETSPLTAAG